MNTLNSLLLRYRILPMILVLGFTGALTLFSQASDPVVGIVSGIESGTPQCRMGEVYSELTVGTKLYANSQLRAASPARVTILRLKDTTTISVSLDGTPVTVANLLKPAEKSVLWSMYASVTTFFTGKAESPTRYGGAKDGQLNVHMESPAKKPVTSVITNLASQSRPSPSPDFSNVLQTESFKSGATLRRQSFPAETMSDSKPLQKEERITGAEITQGTDSYLADKFSSDAPQEESLIEENESDMEALVQPAGDSPDYGSGTGTNQGLTELPGASGLSIGGREKSKKQRSSSKPPSGGGGSLEGSSLAILAEINSIITLADSTQDIATRKGLLVLAATMYLEAGQKDGCILLLQRILDEFALSEIEQKQIRQKIQTIQAMH